MLEQERYQPVEDLGLAEFPLPSSIAVGRFLSVSISTLQFLQWPGKNLPRAFFACKKPEAQKLGANARIDSLGSSLVPMATSTPNFPQGQTVGIVGRFRRHS
jgi:hypothetical protein